MKTGIISQIRAEGYQAGLRDGRALCAQHDQNSTDSEREIGRLYGLAECAPGHKWIFVFGTVFGWVIGLLVGVKL